MPETDIAAGPDRFEVRVTADTGWLAAHALGVERTMMSWISNAYLIGFGF